MLVPNEEPKKPRKPKKPKQAQGAEPTSRVPGRFPSPSPPPLHRSVS